MGNPPMFSRANLAKKMAKTILTNAAASAISSGLFLAAPRRTGKSTFIRNDLKPELEKEGAVVLYVDLWADKKADPGDVIIGAVRAELAKHEGAVARLAKSAGMEKAKVGGLSFSLDRIGLGHGVSLSVALAELSDEVKRPLVLVIDEAQHAITTENGYNAIFALKAARDEINSSSHHGLRIVATGSNRDKLAMLRNSKDQAFFGAPLVAFPTLDKEYVVWFCNQANLPAALDPDEVQQLFAKAAYRPEILGAAADDLRLIFNLDAEHVRQRFTQAVEEQISAADSQVLRIIRGLTPLQSTVLRVLAARKDSYAPFEEATMAVYRDVLRHIAPGDKTRLDISSVQAALTALQEKTLVWKEKRGIYAIEESSTADLLDSSGLLAVVPPLQDDEAIKNRKPGHKR